MKTILVTGSNGYLAKMIYTYNKDKYHWILMTRKDADFANPDAVEKFISKQNFDYCLHCAANAQTALCEKTPELAHAINVESTKRIVDTCKKKNAKLIFCSTEQVFNGLTNDHPLKEDELPKSVSVYGNNKIECEKYIIQAQCDAIILRFSWMMGLSFDGVKASANIAENVFKAILTQTPTLFTANEKRCLTYAKLLANQFDRLIDLPCDIYHVACHNDKTTYEAACYIAKCLGCSDEAIKRYILKNEERYQDRFRDYRLDSTKLKQLGIDFKTFEENVDELLKDFQWI